MNMRSLAFGAALGIGGLSGIDFGARALLDQPEVHSLTDCNNKVKKTVCRQPGEPVDVYVSIVASENDKPRSLPRNELLLTGLGTIAAAAGSLILLHSACKQIANSMDSEPKPAAS